MKKNNLLTIFVFLTFIILPLSEVLRVPITRDITFNPLDLMAGLTSIVWVICLITGKYKKPGKSALLLFFAFPVFGFVSLVLNSFALTTFQIIVAILYIARLTVYLSFFFIIQELDSKEKNQLQNILMGVGSFIVFAGFIQYFFYPSLRNLYYLGWDEHLYRMFSTFLDPNFAGAFFVFLLLFISGKLYIAFQSREKNKAIVFCLLLGCTLLALFLTYSRSALIMLIISFTVFLFLIKQKKLLFILFLTIIGMVVVISPWFYLENINLFRINSSEARLQTSNNALHIIQDHVVFGIGFNAYRYAQQRYGFRADTTPFPSHADAGVDNSWLFVLATTGIVGVLIYLWFWKSILTQLYKKVKKGNIQAIVIFASLVGLFVDALFINSLFYAPFLLWILAWIGMQSGD